MRDVVADDKWRRRAILTGWITAGACFGLFAATIPFVLPAMRKYCLPYVPATPVQIRTVLSVLKGRSGKVIDLGSGDGRVVGKCVHVHTSSLISILVSYQDANTLVNPSYSNYGLYIKEVIH